MKSSVSPGSEERFENGISYILIGGVALSLVLEIAGIIIFFMTYRNVDVSQGSEFFIHGRGFFSFVFSSLFTGSAGLAIRLMLAGMIILLLTPYARVLLSVGYFALARNAAYVLITLFVLVVLTLSLIFH
jgi:uncharacterized membrane protein